MIVHETAGFGAWPEKLEGQFFSSETNWMFQTDRDRQMTSFIYNVVVG